MARKSKEFRQLFYPDSVQQQSPSAITPQRQKELASFQLFKQEIQNDPSYEGAVFVDHPKNIVKMSKVLMEYVEPFLEDTETYQQRSTIFKIAVTAWNLALVSEEERQKAFNQRFSDNSSDPEDIKLEKEVRKLMKKLIKRKLIFFAEEERFVTDYKLTENEGRMHLAVASSLSL
jgi:hypothetical protein